MKRLLSIVALCMLAFGCEKQNDSGATVIELNKEYQAQTVGAGEQTGLRVLYTLHMPQGMEYMASAIAVKAAATASWIVDVESSAYGRITFGVTANTGSEQRIGSIIITAEGAEAAEAIVIQKPSDGSGDNGNDGEDNDNDDNGDDNGDSGDDDGDDNNGDDGDDDNGDGDNGDDNNDDDNGDDDNNDDSGDNGDDDNQGDTVVTNIYRSGWPELPCTYEQKSGNYIIDSRNSTLYYAHHLCAGGEKNAQNNGSARNYTVCFSSEHHCPVWVAAPRHKMYEGDVKRSDAYRSDPDIPANIQYQQESSGNSTYNRGHMLGSAERTSSSATNRQVFYYTNIAPQNTNTFNTGGGAWNILEEWIDDKVCADTTYVVIGTYFEKHTDSYGNTAAPSKIAYGGRNDVSCPTMFYYAVLRTKRGNSGKSVINCSKDELMCAVFVRNHKCEKGTKVNSKDMISVAELEELTGFTYFGNVPNAPKESFNPSDWGL